MRILFVVLSLIIFSCVSLSAATLNFDVQPKGIATQPLRFDKAAVVESNGGSLFVYGSGDFGIPLGGGVCGLQADPGWVDFACRGDVSLLFIGPVSNLAFRGFDAAPSDRATITAYVGAEIASVMLVSGTGAGVIDIDFNGISGITQIDIVDRSSAVSRGIAYGGFTFDVDPPGNVPKTPSAIDFLSFDIFEKGVNASTLDLGIAVLRETSGGRIFVYRTGDFDMPLNGGFCALHENGRCMGDFELSFDTPIFDLIFSGFFAKPTDSAIISLFDGDLLIFSDRFFGNTAGTIRFDFTAVGKLTRLLITDASDVATKGIAYGDFRYRVFVEPPARIPLPASVLFLLACVLVFPILRLRKDC